MSLLIQEIGCEVRLENLSERPFDVKANVLDSTKLQKQKGWKPIVKFGEGLLCTHE